MSHLCQDLENDTLQAIRNLNGPSCHVPNQVLEGESDLERDLGKTSQKSRMVSHAQEGGCVYLKETSSFDWQHVSNMSHLCEDLENETPQAIGNLNGPYCHVPDQILEGETDLEHDLGKTSQKSRMVNHALEGEAYLELQLGKTPKKSRTRAHAPKQRFEYIGGTSSLATQQEPNISSLCQDHKKGAPKEIRNPNGLCRHVSNRVPELKANLQHHLGKALKKPRTITHAPKQLSTSLKGTSSLEKQQISNISLSCQDHRNGTLQEIENLNVHSCHAHDQVPTWESDIEHHSDNDDIGVRKKRGRGSTKLSSILPGRGEPKHLVTWFKNSPAGTYANKLASYLGNKSREPDVFPLHKCWGREHDRIFLTMWKDLKRHFDFVSFETGLPPNMNLVYDWCKVEIQGRLREYRSKLKSKYFDCTKPIEEQERESPSNKVSQQQWELLLAYWISPTSRLDAIQNTINRGMKRPTCTLGTKSYATKHFEMVLNGNNPSELAVYLEAHLNKMGEYPDDDTRDIVDCIQEKAILQNVDDSHDPLDLIPIIDDVCGGHHGGYQRGYGIGVSKCKLKNAVKYSVIQEEYDELQRNYDKQARELQKLKERMANIKEQDSHSGINLSRKRCQARELKENLDQPMKQDNPTGNKLSKMRCHTYIGRNPSKRYFTFNGRNASLKGAHPTHIGRSSSKF